MVRNIIFSFIIILYLVSNGHGSTHPGSIDVDFDNAPLQEVIFTISEFTGTGFVWPENSVTVNWTQKNIPSEEIIPLFNDILSSYGLISIPLTNRDKFYSVQSTSHLTSSSKSHSVYFPKYIPVESLKDTLANLFGVRLSFISIEANNCIFVAGSPTTIENFISFVSKIDRPAKNHNVVKFTLKNIPVKEALATIKDFKTESDILPDYWNHAIIIRGSLDDIAEITTALKEIDKPQKGYADKIGFISAIDPKQAIQVLSGLYPDVKIETVTNHKILFSGPADQVNDSLAMLQKLDGSDYQVKVEAIIASLTDTEFHELGLKLTSNKGPSYKIVLNDAFDTLLVNHSGLLIDYFSDLLGLHLAAEDSTAHGEILSSPVLTVLNGHTARLHVGQNVPFLKKARVEETQGQKEGIEIERHDIGLTFDITPSIDANGEFIYLTVNQIVSSIQPETENSVQASDIITDKKELKTTVLVADGDTIFLGGLKSNETGTSTSHIPLLGDLPLLGQLFTYDSDKNVTRHLVMSIRVNVIEKS